MKGDGELAPEKWAREKGKKWVGKPRVKERVALTTRGYKSRK